MGGATGANTQSLLMVFVHGIALGAWHRFRRFPEFAREPEIRQGRSLALVPPWLNFIVRNFYPLVAWTHHINVKSKERKY